MKRTPTKALSSAVVPVYEIDCSYEAEMRLHRKLAAREKAKVLIAQNHLREASKLFHEFTDPLVAFLESLASVFSNGELTKKSEVVVINGETIWRNCDALNPAKWHGPN